MASGAYKKFWRTYTILGMETAFERAIADTQKRERRRAARIVRNWVRKVASYLTSVNVEREILGKKGGK